MDDKLKAFNSLLLLSLTLAILFSQPLAKISVQELETAVESLRSRGYNLFGNSIAVSDILSDILSGDNFTLLCPPDSALFSLDMSTDAFNYVQSLRFHVIPRRLSLADLRDLSSSSPYVESLVPHHLLFVANHRRELTIAGNVTVLEFVSVDGVRVSFPDVYVGSQIAAHGLDGSLAAGVVPPESMHGDLGFVPQSAWPPQGHKHPPAPGFEQEFIAPASSPAQIFSPNSAEIPSSPANVGRGDMRFTPPYLQPGFASDVTEIARTPTSHPESPALPAPESAMYVSSPLLEPDGITPVYSSPDESPIFASSPLLGSDNIRPPNSPPFGSVSPETSSISNPWKSGIENVNTWASSKGSPKHTNNRSHQSKNSKDHEDEGDSHGKSGRKSAGKLNSSRSELDFVAPIPVSSFSVGSMPSEISENSSPNCSLKGQPEKLAPAPAEPKKVPLDNNEERSENMPSCSDYQSSVAGEEEQNQEDLYEYEGEEDEFSDD
ncbi:hypothetical protein Ancab_026768 [Ancistrocladus abbreviatus]